MRAFCSTNQLSSMVLDWPMFAMILKYLTDVQYFAIVRTMKPCTTGQAARAAKISRATLQFWISSGKIAAPAVQPIEGRAVRLWKASDIQKLRAVKIAIYRKGRGRKPKKKGSGR